MQKCTTCFVGTEWPGVPQYKICWIEIQLLCYKHDLWQFSCVLALPNSCAIAPSWTLKWIVYISWTDECFFLYSFKQRCRGFLTLWLFDTHQVGTFTDFQNSMFLVFDLLKLTSCYRVTPQISSSPLPSTSSEQWCVLFWCTGVGHWRIMPNICSANEKPIFLW